ncbi:hypothetical protein DFH08DRAFT_826263 [Mycena albidolilacea]|uniref:Uncharacterized protein n=1 Tax=Mycena albidolilacea TaxID=1033008 RepID=A0AAD6Z0S2_9AGAR|nr:hypothetical protein DFH08DRAFT_826263 [Mycena albidolilacea]
MVLRRITHSIPLESPLRPAPPTTGLPIAAQLVRRLDPLALWMRISSGPYSRELTSEMLSPLFDIPHLCDRVVNLKICASRHRFRFLYTRPTLRFPALESLDLNILQPAGEKRVVYSPDIESILELFKLALELRRIRIQTTQCAALEICDFDGILDGPLRENCAYHGTSPSAVPDIADRTSVQQPSKKNHNLMKFFKFPHLRHLDVDVKYCTIDDLSDVQAKCGFHRLASLGLRTLAACPTIENLILDVENKVDLLPHLTYSPRIDVVPVSRICCIVVGIWTGVIYIHIHTRRQSRSRQGQRWRFRWLFGPTKFY